MQPFVTYPQFRFYITQNFSGVHEPFSNSTLDVTTNNISETSQSVTVNGKFNFSAPGVIHVNCFVSDHSGNAYDNLTTSIRLCG